MLVVQTSISPPYPKDVKVEDNEDDDGVLTVSRTCANLRDVERTEEELLERRGRSVKYTSLLNFELGMLALLGVSLPVVYWRKIRIRHL